MPDSAVVYVDDVCIPYSWYTVTENANNCLYVMVNDTVNRSFHYYLFKIEQGVYSGYTLTDAIQLSFQAVTQAIFTVTYNNIRNEIEITKIRQYRFLDTHTRRPPDGTKWYVDG